MVGRLGVGGGNGDADLYSASRKYMLKQHYQCKKKKCTEKQGSTTVKCLWAYLSDFALAQSRIVVK